MAQYLKDDVRARIRLGALRVFAAEGYADATMARIGSEAGVSTGNLYRYYENKEKLFEAVVPRSVVSRFRTLLSARIAEAGGAGDVRDLAPEHTYWLAAGQLFDFVLEHRLEVVTFLGRARGTPYEGLRDEVVAELVGAAEARWAWPAGRMDDRETLRFDLEQIYRNFVASLVHILARFDDQGQIREAVRAYERYHLAGLAALLQ